MIRQVYEIAELGKPPGTKTSCPTYLQLKVSSAKVAGGDDTIDFRDEVLAQMYDAGDPRPLRKLTFDIEVSDQGEFHGWLNKRLVGAVWRHIGQITFDEGVVSHNGDFVIHFHHPKWRKDVNDPDSVTGPGRLGRAINRIAAKVGGIIDIFRRQK